MGKTLLLILRGLLLLVGLALLLGGGTCMAFLLPEAWRVGNGSNLAPFLLVSVLAFGVGLILLVTMLRARGRADDSGGTGAPSAGGNGKRGE